MKKFIVLNVGQGDSIIISPGPECKYQNENIFVDLGSGNRDVLEHNPDEKKIIISISHSHDDHMGGLSSIVKHHSEIKEIWLPYYYDEIKAFIDFILNLKGINNLPLDFGLLHKARGAIYSSTLIANITEAFNIPIVGLNNSEQICEHIKILNPQVKVEKNLDISITKLNQYINELKESDFSELRSLIPENKFSRLRNTILTEGWSYDIPRLINEIDYQSRTRMVLGLILKHLTAMRHFVSNPSKSSFGRLFVALEKNINNLSTIIHFKDENDDALFTGDVSAPLLKKLNKAGALPQTKILKIPHHGSKRSISKEILEHIAPKTAIISHNNGLFGRQKDPHPNDEVIKMLDALNIETLYTNDVIKNGKTIKSKPKDIDFNPSIDFIDR